MRRITYTYTVGELPGKCTLRTGKEAGEAEISFRRMIINSLYNIGITCFSNNDIQISKVEQEKIDNPSSEPEEEYQIVSFLYNGEPGPEHLLAGQTPEGGCICGTNRDINQLANQRSLKPGEKWQGKYCASCHKFWSTKERNRKAEAA